VSPKNKVQRAKNKALIRVGVDTGGTFTDFVFARDGRLELFKLPSTPSDPSLAIQQGLDRICADTGTSLHDIEIVHGTTVGTNALLQRRGARIGLITTKGFEDVLAIGRQARPELYNLNAIRPPALVADDLRLGISERVVASGEVLQRLDERELRLLVKKLKQAGVEAVAVSLLFSFLHPEHEEHIAASLASLEVPLSISNRILPEYREYERTSTVVINAYLQPLMGRYLERLLQAHTKHPIQNTRLRLRVMQSSGGSVSAEVAAAEPVRTILSGPSGGVVGALRAAQSAGIKNVIGFDMGGTSTDVALCDGGSIRTTNEAIVAGLPVAIPVMDIHTVGSGGGSIARVDEGGSLRVGPESAGADPGPACYGRSMLPTVTDAHLVLGHFGGAGLLGGEFTLDEARARQAIARLAEDLSKVSGKRCSVTAAAAGVIAVANTNMERALRYISVERGHDPRQFALLPFGGAGGLHAVDLARALRIPTVIVPTAPGALSAVGALVADVVKDQSRTVMFSYGAKEMSKLEKVFVELEKEATRVLRAEGFPAARQRHKRSFAMRYQGQSFELDVEQTTNDLAAAFHRVHRERYGYARENSEIEIVSARLRSHGLVEKLAQRKAARKAGKAKPTNKVYRREELGAGARLEIPCIVTEYSATTLITGGAEARVDEYGNLLISVN
jgi:N-methylhydantoinase A